MIEFSKMQGIGNDFVMLDGIASPRSEADLPGLSRWLCDRRRSVGGDGLILLERAADSGLRMRMFNPDGSESEMCGNGLRCLVRFAADLGYIDRGPVDVETGAGILACELFEDGSVSVLMGVPKPVFDDFNPIDLGFQNLKGVGVSMGNPHLVVFAENVEQVPLGDWGPVLEHHRRFPNRVNVHFAQIVSDGHVAMRTWERGAGITLACGTGACAVAAAAFVSGRAGSRQRLSLPGGDLTVEIGGSAATLGAAKMTGPAETVFVGSIAPQEAGSAK